MSIFAILSQSNFNITNLEMPVVFIVGRYGIFYKYIYCLVVGIAIFTTAISVGYGYLQNYENNKEKYNKKIILLILCSIIAIPIGFSKLIELLYPIFGGIGLVQSLYVIKKKRKDIFIISIVCFIFAITLIGMYKVQKQQKYENNYNNIIQRLCSDYYVGDQLALAYREPASLVVMYSGGLTQKKVIQFCDYLNINDFKKIKIIKTEFSNNPTISYINQDNQEKQYEFYIMSQKGDIKVTIVILKNNIIKILDDENHQVHYYQSQNINYEKLNIDHLPW